MVQKPKGTGSGKKQPDNNEARLNALEQKIEVINKNKKITSITTYIGLLVIIVTLAFFIFNMISYFKNYKTGQLVYKVQQKLPELANTKSSTELFNTFKTELGPKYAKALMKEFNNQSMLFAKDIHKQKRTLAFYIQNDLRDRLLNNMVNKLSKTEASKLTFYFKDKLPPEKLKKLNQITHKILLKRLTEALNKQLSPAVAHIKEINSSFNALYKNMEKAGEFKDINPQQAGEVQNRLIEALLESLIYEINPQKGSMPVK
ncbi:MAG: hypothetical protein K9M56_09925 [Victivallales bacterium]|nr:hypothetical protein [Victivallales bacterium]